jgi:hypothetical protein
MIIAFYPGAGGNRYLRNIQGLEWQKTNMSYDVLNDQDFKYRYLLEDSVNQHQEFILTHCLNCTHLQKKLPGHKITYIISNLKISLKREWSLAGHNRFAFQQTIQDPDRIEHYNAFKDKSWPVCDNYDDLKLLPARILQEVNDDYYKNVQRSTVGILKELETEILNKINSSYEIIKWHKEYYTAYPVEFSNDCTIIDTTSGHDDFSNIMQRELKLYDSEIFDLVWNKLHD